MKLTEAQQRALMRAAKRERRNICPAFCHAAAETNMIAALDRKGLIDWDGGVPFKGAPRINSAGFAAIDA